MRRRIAAEPNIRCLTGRTVVGVDDRGRDLTVASTHDGSRDVDGYDDAVNALWSDRLAIDAQVGLGPERPWSFRLRYFLHGGRATVRDRTRAGLGTVTPAVAELPLSDVRVNGAWIFLTIDTGSTRASALPPRSPPSAPREWCSSNPAKRCTRVSRVRIVYQYSTGASRDCLRRSRDGSQAEAAPAPFRVTRSAAGTLTAREP
jgi:hypothetical protein